MHPTIAHNTGGDGSGVYASSGATAALSYNIVAGQTVGVSAASGSTTSLNRTLWGNGAWANGQNTAGPGSISSTGGATGNPSFVNPAGGDFHITKDSAAVDGAVGSPVLIDIDNGPRTAVGFGTAPDLGRGRSENQRHRHNDHPC